MELGIYQIHTRKILWFYRPNRTTAPVPTH